MDARRIELEEEMAWMEWENLQTEVPMPYSLEAGKVEKGTILVQPMYESSVCKKTEAHSLENPSTSDYMFVLSIKSE